jgi:hypothetical protein
MQNDMSTISTRERRKGGDLSRDASARRARGDDAVDREGYVGDEGVALQLREFRQVPRRLEAHRHKILHAGMSSRNKIVQCSLFWSYVEPYLCLDGKVLWNRHGTAAGRRVR